MSMQPEQLVVQQVRVRCLAPTARRDVGAELRYDADDPFAVALTVHTGGDTYVRWEVARTLLTLGITEPTGLGDISVWPYVDSHGRDVVVLNLRSRHGQIVGEVATSDLQRFLSRTLALVPVGGESARLDVDRVVDRLLSS